jgi:hypothetical protein
MSAMVALDVAGNVAVDALVSAGWGIEVSDRLIEWNSPREPIHWMRQAGVSAAVQVGSFG